MAVGILLAAGFSRRFGAEDKLMQLLPDGRPLALAAAQNLLAALPRTVAVVRPEAVMLAALLAAAGAEVVTCAADKIEMADSLATAVRYAAGHTEANSGYVIALADMPFIQPQTIAAVAVALADGALIAAPAYRQQRGHPVAFAAGLRAELENLRGDEGARSVLQRHRHEIHVLEVADSGVLADIDTPHDLPAA